MVFIDSAFSPSYSAMYSPFGDLARELTVRAQSATSAGCWIFLRREG